jgi:hypothetical protein
MIGDMWMNEIRETGEIASIKIYALLSNGRTYYDKSDIIAWLRKSALLSKNAPITANTMEELANNMEKWGNK